MQSKRQCLTTPCLKCLATIKKQGESSKQRSGGWSWNEFEERLRKGTAQRRCLRASCLFWRAETRISNDNVKILKPLLLLQSREHRTWNLPRITEVMLCFEVLFQCNCARNEVLKRLGADLFMYIDLKLSSFNSTSSSIASAVNYSKKYCVLNRPTCHRHCCMP